VPVSETVNAGGSAAGPNGLMAANLPADAGCEVPVLEAVGSS
jgi:hypothetical protein